MHAEVGFSNRDFSPLVSSSLWHLQQDPHGEDLEKPSLPHSKRFVSLRNVQGSANHKAMQASYYLETEVVFSFKCTHCLPSVSPHSARLAVSSIVTAKRAVEMA